MVCDCCSNKMLDLLCFRRHHHKCNNYFTPLSFDLFTSALCDGDLEDLKLAGFYPFKLSRLKERRNFEFQQYISYFCVPYLVVKSLTNFTLMKYGYKHLNFTTSDIQSCSVRTQLNSKSEWHGPATVRLVAEGGGWG